jgi:hypothetical protein
MAKYKGIVEDGNDALKAKTFGELLQKIFEYPVTHWGDCEGEKESFGSFVSVFRNKKYLFEIERTFRPSTSSVRIEIWDIQDDAMRQAVESWGKEN